VNVIECLQGTVEWRKARAGCVTASCIVDVMAKGKGSAGSPDGLVGADGGVEIKAPNTSSHVDYIIRGGVPSKYVAQMQWLMACTGRAWWDFVSFDNRLPADLSLLVVRLPRDEKFIAEAEAAVGAFNAEVEQYIETLKRKAEKRG
jgi:hypothetical protein